MKRFFTILLLLTSHLNAQTVNLKSVFSGNGYEQFASEAKVNYLGEEEQAFLVALNLVRSEPQKFCEDFLIPFLKERPDLKSPNSASLIRTLKKTKSMATLQPNLDLSIEAKNHAISSGIKGYTGHKGFQQRVKNLEGKVQNLHEANSYGDVDGLEFLLNLLIDEGVPDLGHRKILLDPSHTLIGLYIADHKRYGKNVVSLLGNTFEN